MNTFFQRLKSRGGSAEKSGPSSLTLAAFGKHPGWDDHIPGIGVETDELAYVKQTLYVSGVGRQIDSGAWEKLDFDKRLEGFDHIFLWERPDDILLGRLWSSTDRKGRSKYPMVLCVDGRGVSTEGLLAKTWSELEKLRETCKAVTTAEQVIAECRVSQERLRGPISTASSNAGPGSDARRRFIQHADLGPDRVGFLRILHELGIPLAADSGKRSAASNENAARSSHLRVPATGGSTAESLALWSAFFQSALPKATSVLFIIRRDAQWLDVIVQPTTDDFFCFQASLNALPLTTAIPYELSPDLKPLLEQVESRFLGETPSAFETAQHTRTNPPALQEQKAVETSAPRKKWKLFFLLILFALILIGGVLFWLNATRHGAKTASTEKAPVEVSNTPAVAQPDQSILTGTNYSVAMQAARAALERKDYAGAVASANEALGYKANDPEANRLRADAQAQQRVADARTEGQLKYKQAMDSAKTALARADFAGAIQKADAALASKPNDEAALKLKSAAKAQQDTALTAQAAQKNYETALKLGGEKLVEGDYSGAISQAEAALNYKTNDSAALKLKTDAAAGLARERQKDYEAAMKTGRTALANKQYQQAVAFALQALQIKPGDAAAADLKNSIQVAQQNLSTQSAQDANYKQALAAAQSAFDAKDYAKAVEQADLALGFRTNDSAAADLKSRSSELRDLSEAQRDFDQGKYDQALNLCMAHAGASSFSPLAEQIKKKKLGELDSNLELYMVWFGILNPKDAKTNKAQSSEARQKAQELASADFSFQVVNYYLGLADALERDYKAGSWLDDERKKELTALRKTIQNHQ